MNINLSLIKKTLIFLIIFPVVFVSGCWDRQELEDLTYVLAMGIDYLEDEDKIEVTTSFIRPANVGGEQGGGGALQTFRLLTTKGDTLSQALEQQNTLLARLIYFGHADSIIVGEKLARRGLHSILDRLVRERDLRLTTHIFVTDRDIKEVMRTEAKIEEGIPFFLAKWSERRQHVSLGPTVELRQFVKNLLSEGIDPISTFITTRTEIPISPQEVELAGDVTEQENPPDKVRYPKISGTAVFKEDKLVGFLDQIETKGLLYVLEEIEDGTEVITDPFGNPGKIVFLVIGNKSRITPLINGAEPEVLIEATTELELC